MAFQALIQLSQASSQPPQASNWLSQALHQPSVTSYQTIQGPQLVLFSPSTNSGRTNESPLVLQDFFPFGAAALLPLTQIIKQSKATGNPDHIAHGRLVISLSHLRVC